MIDWHRSAPIRHLRRATTALQVCAIWKHPYGCFCCLALSMLFASRSQATACQAHRYQAFGSSEAAAASTVDDNTGAKPAFLPHNASLLAFTMLTSFDRAHFPQVCVRQQASSGSIARSRSGVAGGMGAGGRRPLHDVPAGWLQCLGLFVPTVQ